jgi:hypothetical protein
MKGCKCNVNFPQWLVREERRQIHISSLIQVIIIIIIIIKNKNKYASFWYTSKNMNVGCRMYVETTTYWTDAYI